MEGNKQCPLCGKLIDDIESYCEECKNHIDNQYTTDWLGKEDSLEAEKNEIEDKNYEKSTGANSQTDSKRKKRLSGGVIFVLIGCLVLVLVGAIGSLRVLENRKSTENEEAFWSKCLEENTPVSYAKYLVAFQEGKYVEEASERIRTFRQNELLEWTRLSQSSDIHEFYSYLAENPNTPYINRIKYLMDSLSWIEAEKDNTAEGYKTYLENVEIGNLAGNYLDKASLKYNYLSQIKTIEGASLDSLFTDLNRAFKILSENNVKDLLKIFSPELFFYKTDSLITSTDAVARIQDNIAEEKIATITYFPELESVIAKKDNVDISFIDLPVKKEIVYNIKIKVDKKTENKKVTLIDTIQLELDKNRQIRSILKK